MILSVGYLTFKDKAESKGVSIVLENSALGAKQKGCLGFSLSKNTENPGEILLISKWVDETSYTNAIANMKRDSTARKLFLKILPYLDKQPTYKTYNIVSE